MLMCRAGHNRLDTPYMTVYLMKSLPKLPYIHGKYMVLANPTHVYINLLLTTSMTPLQQSYTDALCVYVCIDYVIELTFHP
jgi:hypothetical protein